MQFALGVNKQLNSFYFPMYNELKLIESEIVIRLFITPSYAFPIPEYQYSCVRCIYSFMT